MTRVLKTICAAALCFTVSIAATGQPSSVDPFVGLGPAPPFPNATAGNLEDGLNLMQGGYYEGAMRVLLPLAEKGNTTAQEKVGWMYHSGAEGVPRNDPLAAIYFRKAADKGDAEAQLELGSMYFRGVGVLQDYTQAHVWLNLSASRATDDGVQKEALRLRDEVAAKMTPTEVAEADRLAREWKPTAEPMK